MAASVWLTLTVSTQLRSMTMKERYLESLKEKTSFIKTRSAVLIRIFFKNKAFVRKENYDKIKCIRSIRCGC